MSIHQWTYALCEEVMPKPVAKPPHVTTKFSSLGVEKKLTKFLTSKKVKQLVIRDKINKKFFKKKSQAQPRQGNNE